LTDSRLLMTLDSIRWDRQRLTRAILEASRLGSGITPLAFNSSVTGKLSNRKSIITYYPYRHHCVPST